MARRTATAFLSGDAHLHRHARVEDGTHTQVQVRRQATWARPKRDGLGGNIPEKGKEDRTMAQEQREGVPQATTAVGPFRGPTGAAL